MMGDAYKRFIYKGAFEKPGGLIGEVEYLGFDSTQTGAVVDYIFFAEATASGGTIVRQVQITFNTTTLDNVISAKRVS